jgi:hypothetical protein
LFAVVPASPPSVVPPPKTQLPLVHVQDAPPSHAHPPSLGLVHVAPASVEGLVPVSAPASLLPPESTLPPESFVVVVDESVVTFVDESPPSDPPSPV